MEQVLILVTAIGSMFVLIGLVILGGVYYAIRAWADGHLLWFSAVLFLLGTWM